MAVGVGETYRVAFDEGRRAVDEQARTIRDVRDRAGTTLSAASVTIGLGAGLSAGAGARTSAWGVAGAAIAGLGFVLIAVQAVRVWWPVEVTFNLDSGTLVGSFAERDEPMALPEMHRELALHLGRHVQANRVRIDARLRWFSYALIGLLLEIAGLLILLIDIAR